MLHDDFGHPGIKKTLSRVKERYFWPGLAKFVKHYCAVCHFCAINKGNKAPNNDPLLPISTHNLELFEKVAIAILGPLPVTKDGSKYFCLCCKIISLNGRKPLLWNLLIQLMFKTGSKISELITDQGVQFISQSFQIHRNQI